ncbi:unnamed protein product [Diplocarpon coronariae]
MVGSSSSARDDGGRRVMRSLSGLRVMRSSSGLRIISAHREARVRSGGGMEANLRRRDKISPSPHLSSPRAKNKQQLGPPIARRGAASEAMTSSMRRLGAVADVDAHQVGWSNERPQSCRAMSM